MQTPFFPSHNTRTHTLFWFHDQKKKKEEKKKKKKKKSCFLLLFLWKRSCVISAQKVPPTPPSPPYTHPHTNTHVIPFQAVIKVKYASSLLTEFASRNRSETRHWRNEWGRGRLQTRLNETCKQPWMSFRSMSFAGSRSSDLHQKDSGGGVYKGTDALRSPPQRMKLDLPTVLSSTPPAGQTIALCAPPATGIPGFLFP